MMITPAKPTTIDTDHIAVRVEDVHKTYHRGSTSTTVLSGVDLTIKQGECVFLAGPSGSGKSTLLSIIGCILTADRGRVQILDKDIRTLDQMGRTNLRRDEIGFVFQRFHLIRGLTALENVCVPLALKSTDLRTARQRGCDLLEAVGLADKLHARPESLSTGQCQRVAIARALAVDPKVILADEPTASLDAENGQDVMQLFRQLTADQGRTAVVVTHDQRIFHFADRVLHLENGHVVETTQTPSVATPC